jgi:hypothetical protein
MEKMISPFPFTVAEEEEKAASAQNTIVALYQEYSRYHYLYFTIEKQ